LLWFAFGFFFDGWLQSFCGHRAARVLDLGIYSASAPQLLMSITSGRPHETLDAFFVLRPDPPTYEFILYVKKSLKRQFDKESSHYNSQNILFFYLASFQKAKKRKRGSRGGIQTNHGGKWRQQLRTHRDAVAD
jgi:hypothetical protein